MHEYSPVEDAFIYIHAFTIELSWADDQTVTLCPYFSLNIIVFLRVIYMELRFLISWL